MTLWFVYSNKDSIDFSTKTDIEDQRFRAEPQKIFGPLGADHEVLCKFVLT